MSEPPLIHAIRRSIKTHSGRYFSCNQLPRLTIEGKISFRYNNGSYTLDLKENNSLILFNPSTNLPIDASVQKNTKYLSLLITIKKFHGLFSELTDDISFLSQENSDKKYYKENIISPQISIILNQIINEKLSENVKNLYLKGKIFELLGIYFNESNDFNTTIL